MMTDEHRTEDVPGPYDRVPHYRSIVVTKGQEPERIDLFLTHAVLRATRNKVQEAILAGAVLVNGKPTKANYKVRPGDTIEITLMKPPPIELIPQDIPLDIRYEDDHLIVLHKPAGLVTHPGFGNRDGTLVNALLYHMGFRAPVESIEIGEDEGEESADEESTPVETAGDESSVRPGIVHRLDKETSGLMVVAKSAAVQAELARQFAERSVKREYWAVAWGVIEEDEGEIEGNIARDTRDRKRFAVSKRDGKYALTRFEVKKRFEFLTLLALRLATGRTHQIRVHCAHIGHPLFGDPTYGGRQVVFPGPGGKHRYRVANLLKIMERQALHARTLGFRHPVTREWLEFESELPDDMKKLVEEIEN
jgi:23S rRNA pseudouridine1911/1915/1917 synthase